MRPLVALPVYNEEAHIRRVIGAVRRHYDGDILAVDDGSTDETPRILNELSGVTALTHERNLGYGRAVIDIFAHALKRGYGELVIMDCDEQHEPRFIPDLFRSIAGTDVCSCSRYLAESERNDAPPADRLDINLRITAIINGITGYGLTDSFCGMKGYRVEALRPLDLRESGYASPLEFWMQAFHFGLRVREFPITRIYKNLNRTFGGEMDDPRRRYAYYLGVIEREAERWSISLPSGLIPTT